MWKLVVGFILFAALSLYVLSTGGDIDMSGEKHGVDTHEPAASAASAAAPAASEAAPAASAASGS
ncbi:hypothetical protein [Sphaerotilus mobilis]|uniref:Uncharacterized protein n=1 Tax=Sphaerotilus mobilis TaxID=47994 RepID=A0A4Q7LLF4_9BURK|nr:hypothetical protein [Sphaerotilus mobilis]RZS54418.1 hypothetical protein EV685_1895 [Sphaerotilus mobilis]